MSEKKTKVKTASNAAAAASTFSTLNMVMIALFTAILCVLGPMSIPIGPVPLSLATFVIYFSLFFLGWKNGMLSCLIYLFIGFIGVPVFTGFSSGIGKLAGPTGGYLIGYIFLALVAGIFIEKFEKSVVLCFAGMILGTAVLYTFGTAWFCISTGNSIAAALSICVFPFIIGDCIKMAVAAFVAPTAIKQLKKRQIPVN